MNDDREILERAVAAVAEQASETDALVDEAVEIGLGGSAPLAIHAKMIRQGLLRVKATWSGNSNAWSWTVRRAVGECIG